jgi:GPH family glycoside/pentoside/hexuronide:cation symporter
MATRIGNLQLTAFALPAMVSAVMHAPIAGIVPSLYATRFGLDLAAIGTILLIARLFDAVTDPMIGFLSDRTQSRYGRRKPWIVVGALMTVIAVYFLYRPVDHASLGYFLGFSLLVYLAWTVLEIPYQAWALELSRDTTQRTRINAFRVAATMLGGILFTVAPQLVPGAEGRMDFQVLGLIAIVLAIAVPLTTFVAVKFVPQGDVYTASESPSLRELWRSLAGNRAFLYFVVMYVFISLAGGVSGVVTFMYIDTYLGIGANYTQLFLPAVLVGPVTLPLWVWIANRFDKYRTTTVAFLCYSLIMPLAWFVGPGPGAVLPMILYFSALSVFMPLLMITMPAILGDIVDYDELNTGKNRAGQYYAFLALIAKGTAAIGGPIALLLIGLYGYQPGAAHNDPTAITGLRVVFNLVPTLLALPGVFLLWKFPINDAMQQQIRRQLEARDAAKSSAQPEAS